VKHQGFKEPMGMRHKKGNTGAPSLQKRGRESSRRVVERRDAFVYAERAPSFAGDLGIRRKRELKQHTTRGGKKILRKKGQNIQKKAGKKTGCPAEDGGRGGTPLITLSCRENPGAPGEK